MPLTGKKIKVTDSDGSRNDEYCSYCFEDGVFIDQDLTLEDQTNELVAMAVTKMNMPSEEAKDWVDYSQI